MGGFFGTVSKHPCVKDLFYGIDYHSHLGTSAIEKGVEELVNARKLANKIDDEHKKAIAYHDKVEPKLDEIRYQIDKLELIVDDSLWPLPKYRELLFIR